MQYDIKEVLRLRALGKTQRQISHKTHIAKSSVDRILKRSKELGIDWEFVRERSPDEVRKLLSVEPKEPKDRYPIECEEIWNVILEGGITEEAAFGRYLQKAVDSGKRPYSRTTFFNRLSRYRQQNLTAEETSESIAWTQGEFCQIDYCGDKVKIIDRVTGKVQEAHIFAAVLPYSKYSFAYATIDESRESWLKGIVEMLKYFGGAPKVMIMDNAAALVAHPSKFSPVIAKEVLELGKFYNISMEATAPYSPRHKGAVENCVKHLQNSVVAPLRGCPNFSLDDLNKELRRELNKFNSNQMHRYRRSRVELFAEEAPFLQALPKTHYKVGYEYHTYKADKSGYISIRGHRYSVPDAFRRRPVKTAVDSGGSLIIFNADTYEEIGRHHYWGNQATEVTTHVLAEHRAESSVYSQTALDCVLEEVKKIHQDVYSVALRCIGHLHENASNAFKTRLVRGIKRFKKSYGEEKLLAACRAALMKEDIDYEGLQKLLDSPMAQNGSYDKTELTALPLLRNDSELQRSINKMRKVHG
jgi:hypothetical protein